jgi:hypothetical protein
MRYRVTGLSNGIGQKSPALFHNFITKRYVEFNFSPEKSFEGEGKREPWFCGYPGYVVQVTFSLRTISLVSFERLLTVIFFCD